MLSIAHLAPFYLAASGLSGSPFELPKRVMMACSHCRERKIKCITDSTEVPCMRCHLTGLSCSYIATRKQRERLFSKSKNATKRRRPRASQHLEANDLPIRVPGGESPLDNSPELWTFPVPGDGSFSGLPATTGPYIAESPPAAYQTSYRRHTQHFDPHVHPHSAGDSAFMWPIASPRPTRPRSTVGQSGNVQYWPYPTAASGLRPHVVELSCLPA
uniref:Zn(2)-C6 fungal-type domain-containing protein n=1 Tax=Mycena chlorophos TaxID=658473 RepID=A0ABQ0L0Z6_MYCCL|nr:predicted protein [Mycena chlorophos]